MFEIVPAIYALAAVWLLSLLVVPIVQKYANKVAFDISFLAGVMSQFFLVLAILLTYETQRLEMLFLLAIPLVGWLAEFVGSRTGIPFGRYSYTDRLRPHFFGVPIAVMFAWAMMILPSWAIGQSIGDLLGTTNRLVVAIISGLAMTAWDLFLDPQMVGFGYWTWKKQKGFFGIPWSNYLGWFLVSTIMSLIFYLPLSRETTILFAIIYVSTALLEFVAQVTFWKLARPALIGLLVMFGVFALPALFRLLA